MTKHIKLFSFFILLLVYSTVYASGNDWNYEKRKSFTQSYPLSSSSKVSVKNSFGNVTINHWAQSEVKVNVTIVVKASTDEAAQSILNSIDIESNGGANPYFETKINGRNQGRNHGRNSSSSMQINYEVYIPANTNLKIVNSFGNTTVPDRKGNIAIFQSYGDLKTGALPNISQLSVEFGSLSSQLLVNTNATLKFSKVKIEKLSGNFDGNFEFCTKPEIRFTNDIHKINIDAKYSDLIITLPAGFDADFNISTKFGRVKNNSSIRLDDNDGKNFTEIRYNSPSNNSQRKVYIRSEFGKVQLQ
ncbi:hypothetical protein A8C56_02375 [Niabella ginsenosidivorans]|uniref:Adhesin domain-containing protein n=1 Tax=Niabella ginsenosidivorans TaxID=1176587 RepID=A0A1A9HXL2_9BACT|nr:hypothetical protein [Niabella ginsenosidivorans]ANH79973.1 hypothetical protein A8C56_02375 [Niabella ginsenosidivorans]